MTFPATLRALLEQIPTAAALSVETQPGQVAVRLTYPEGSAVDVVEALEIVGAKQYVVDATGNNSFTLTFVRSASPTRRQVAVRLPPKLAQDVTEVRDRTGMSATDQLLDAYAQHHRHVRLTAVQRRAVAGLPPGAPQRRTARVSAVQVWLSMSTEELAVLDAAAAEWCSGNRSALATALLGAAIAASAAPLPIEDPDATHATHT